MKKNFLHIFFVFSLITLSTFTTTYGFETNPPPSRWQVISSQNGMTMSFDTATIHFNDNHDNQIQFWLKCSFDPMTTEKLANQLNLSDESLKISYFLEDRILDIKNHTKTINEIDIYDNNNMLIETNRPTIRLWDAIPPDSESDKVYLAITAYITAHKQLIKSNYN